MFRIFLAVFLALLAFRCAVGAEPGPYERFKTGCEQANKKEDGVPAGWCDCLVKVLRERGVSEADLGAAMQPVAPAETFFIVQNEVKEAAASCRAQLRGDQKL